jgi:cell division protein FtsB
MESPTPQQPAKSSGNVTRILVILLIVALSLALIYFIVRTNQTEQQKTELAAKNEDLEAEIKDLDQKVMQMETDIQNKDILLDEKNRKVDELSAELKRAQTRIQQLIAAGKLGAEQADKFKGRIEQMTYYIEKYQNQINELKAENEKLAKENETLSGQVKERENKIAQTQQENLLIKTKLEAAAILKASNFKYIGVNRRGKETPAEGTILREGRTDNLKTCFTILDNEVANPGQRQVYVVIKGPDGSILKSAEPGSSFTFNGQDIPYSAKIAVAYNRKAADVCVVYPKPENVTFAKGNYNVSVYTDGYEVGNSSFSIK